LYAEVAKEMGVPIQPDMQAFKTTYDVQFDPNNVAAYLKATKR
jgi:nitrate/nitrite transport system substrate-binding protein